VFFSVALIHTSTRVVSLLTEVAHLVIADAELIHMVDEGIPRLIDEAGGQITEPVVRRICTYATNAQEAGADVIVLGSPVIGGAIDAVQSCVNVPAIRIDAAMIETAVRYGTSVGVLATQDLTLDPTLAFLRDRADALGKNVSFETRLCEHAGMAFGSGDFDEYDRIVIEEVGGLAGNDVIVLADLMMHRVVPVATERVRVPVLSSPRLGFEDLAKKMNYFRR
jgi:aspartate/glutamate racemase